MKNKLCNFSACFLCSLLLTIGVWGCAAGSFAIHLRWMPLLLWLVLLCGALSYCAAAGRRTAFSLVLLGSTVLALLIYGEDIFASVLYCTGRIVSVYSESFLNWKSAAQALLDAGNGDATAAFVLFSLCFVTPAVYVLSTHKQMEICFLFTHPLLLICLIPDWAPPPVWAFLSVIGCDALMVLTQPHRLLDSSGANRLFLRLAPFVAVFLLLLNLLTGGGSQSRPEWLNNLNEEMTDIREDLALSLDNFFHRNDAPVEAERQEETTHSETLQDIAGWFQFGDELKSTDLGLLTSWASGGDTVMEVQLNGQSLCYLRGVSFAVYEDNSWSLGDRSAYSGHSVSPTALYSSGEISGEVTVRTESTNDLLFVPYYPVGLDAEAGVFIDAYLENTSGADTYTVQWSADSPGSAYENGVPEIYTEVPDSTREAVADIVADLQSRLPVNASTAEIVSAVYSYVKNSAEYSLNTGRMPSGEDFVGWFLHDSDTGYCVHFATAAAVLLRCMDVPARYVTGYLAHDTGEEWTAVTQGNSHAWVEYYTDSSGWLALDPTPGAGSSAAAPQAEVQPGEEIPEDSQTSASLEKEPGKGSEQKEPGGSSETDGTGDGADTAERKRSPAATVILCLLLFALILALWNIGVRRYRKNYLAAGDCNTRTAAAYRYLALLCRFSGHAPPQALTALALEARFSSHTLTADAVEQMRSAADAERERLYREADPLKKAYYFLIRCL